MQSIAAHGRASRCLGDMGMDVRRVARFVRGTATDAWVVVGGSRDVLEWFASQSLPAFALFGRNRRVPMASASPDKIPGIPGVCPPPD